jgi:hypothetical protein
VRVLLEKERHVTVAGATALRMMTQRGHYADRPVTYFRVFGPLAVAGAGRDLRCYDELDPGLILHSGHIERDGMIVLNRQARPD